VRLVALTALFASLVACLEPFGVDRHDLEDDRVAMIGVTPAQAPAGATIEARAAVMVDGLPYADAAPALTWHWLADRDTDTVTALDPDDPADATGPAPSLVVPGFAQRLALVVAYPSGAVERGFVDWDDGDERVPPEVLSLSFDPADAIESGDHRTITAAVSIEDPVPTVRWMTVAGRGTFLEEERLVTGWDAALVVRDDGEVESSDPISDGPVSFVALAIDDRGGSGLRVEERWVGDAPTGLVTTSGRWIGADVAPTAPGPWHGVLEADDDAPTGLRLTGLTAGPVAGTDPWGTAALPCAAPVSGPFDPTWLFLQRCTRAAVVGATVAVSVP